MALTDNGESIKQPSNAPSPKPLDDQTLIKRDAGRRDRVRSLLAAGPLSSASDYHDAAFIFQHSDQPDDYLLAHLLAMQAVVMGDSESRWIAAATLDRYLQSIGRKQVFGTQFLDKGYLYMLQHRSDPDLAQKLQSLKDSDVVVQQPYDEQFLPDAMRQSFCVPPLASQKMQVEQMNRGERVHIPPVPGCQK
ncbi:hypothetical protein [Occallatibacter riparius]|uniref:Uncharacterized protein n=1 Tax=Occallatibacter riparius TaxID=1002689 RepID=A0A9J7BQG7_9BACT|nr:hypothetical protein [Occallatibacter riparius]UWZ83182.1 hypothetical protein MOP44_21750 [Occallatibacter riparius]